jgi:hypothetical protein
VVVVILSLRRPHFDAESASENGRKSVRARGMPTAYAGHRMALLPSPRTVCLALAGFLLAVPASGATKKRHPTPTATPAPTATPTPVPFLRAAGSCLRYEPGAYVVLSEVGQPGRVFRIDGKTEIMAAPRRGVRLRILYEDGADGPIARKIMPGPEERKN